MTADRATGSRALRAIFVGGLIVGVLDLTYAVLVYSPRKPILILQGIASGVLGAKSYGGGARTAALGIILHFLIALGSATVYCVASRYVPFFNSARSPLWSRIWCLGVPLHAFRRAATLGFPPDR
jgi:hypothetical protein